MKKSRDNHHHHHHHHHHQSVLPKSKLQFCPKAGISPKLRNQVCSSAQRQFYYGWIGAVACRCFLHSIFSSASEQTLKDLKRSQRPRVEVRRVDLANWALRILPKFTTGVKYQFHQGFWTDQKSENPNQPSPPRDYRRAQDSCIFAK